LKEGLMLRAIYVAVLRLHPRFFREKFADEMLWIFDQCAGTERATALIRDAVRSLVTQWIFRSEPGDEARLADAAGSGTDRVPSFYTSESEIPPPGALVNGLIGSTIVFGLAAYAVAHGGGRAAIFTYYGGDFHAGPPVYGEATPGGAPSSPGAKTSSNDATGKPNAAALQKQAEAKAHFERVRVLAALDADHDGQISAEEIANAPTLLATLDKNHDGKLDPEELGFRPLRMQQQSGPPPEPPAKSARKTGRKTSRAANSSVNATAGTAAKRAQLNFVRLEPVLAVLDADHDGALSATEIANASDALKALDRNHDGRLTLDEVVLDPVTSEVVSIFRLDTNLDRKISRAEARAPFGRPIQELLKAADRNGDGDVTWEDLTREIQQRADLDHDGVVTWDEMLRARQSHALYGIREPRPGTNQPSRSLSIR
jgi:Ca2+-binding EF-hand superfamily protein